MLCLAILVALMSPESALAAAATPKPSPSASALPKTRTDVLENLPDPVYLEVPAIKVSASIEKVGFDSSFAMAVPKKIEDVGWFYAGSRPGDNQGSAVLDGHLDWYTGPAVFLKLGSLKPKDLIRVWLKNGDAVTFHVTGHSTVSYDTKISDLFRTDGPARLAMITCGGQWDNGKHVYLDRIIVFAVRDAISRPVRLRHPHRRFVGGVDRRPVRGMTRPDEQRGINLFRNLRSGRFALN